MSRPFSKANRALNRTSDRPTEAGLTPGMGRPPPVSFSGTGRRRKAGRIKGHIPTRAAIQKPIRGRSGSGMLNWLSVRLITGLAAANNDRNSNPPARGRISGVSRRCRSTPRWAPIQLSLIRSRSGASKPAKPSATRRWPQIQAPSPLRARADSTATPRAVQQISQPTGLGASTRLSPITAAMTRAIMARWSLRTRGWARATARTSARAKKPMVAPIVWRNRVWSARTIRPVAIASLIQKLGRLPADRIR